jgi:hypothetical protein
VLTTANIVTAVFVLAAFGIVRNQIRANGSCCTLGVSCCSTKLFAASESPVPKNKTRPNRINRPIHRHRCIRTRGVRHRPQPDPRQWILRRFGLELRGDEFFRQVEVLRHERVVVLREFIGAANRGVEHFAASVGLTDVTFVPTDASFAAERPTLETIKRTTSPSVALVSPWQTSVTEDVLEATAHAGGKVLNRSAAKEASVGTNVTSVRPATSSTIWASWDAVSTSSTPPRHVQDRRAADPPGKPQRQRRYQAAYRRALQRTR